MTELLRFILFDMHRLTESKTNLQITDSDGSSLKSLGEVLGEHAVEVDVTVFGARGEAEAVGVEGDGVDGTEMAFDGGELLVVDYVEKFQLESTLLLGGHCDILGVLASAGQHVELLVFTSLEQWADGSVSAREIELEFSNLVKSFWMEQLTEAILTAGEEHGEVL